MAPHAHPSPRPLCLLALALAMLVSAPAGHADALPARDAPGTTSEFVAQQRADIEGRYFTGDSGIGVRASNGVFVNFYGDTIVQPTGNPLYPAAAAQVPYMMRNNALITLPDNRVRGAVPAAKLLAQQSMIDVPTAAQLPMGTNNFWPTSVSTRRDPKTKVNSIYLFLSHIYTPQTGRLDYRRPHSDTWDFGQVSSRLAVYTIDAKGTLILRRLLRTPMALNDPSGVKWGTGSYLDGSTLYVFGSLRPPGEYSWGSDHYLARVPIGSVDRVASWRYWTGTAWSAKAASAAIVIPANFGSESTTAISREAESGLFTFSFKEFAFIGQRVLRAHAPALTGPWTVDAEPIALPELVDEHDFTYCANDIPIGGGATGVIISHGSYVWGTPREKLGIFALL